MNLIPWRKKSQESQLTPIASLRSEVDRLFERFFEDAWPTGRTLLKDSFFNAGWSPSVDISETDKEVTLKVEVPGVDPGNVEVAVEGNYLVIQGEKKEEKEDEGKNYYHVERSFGSFRRTIELPATVDTDTIRAENKNGVLTITAAKQKGAEPKRIPIQISKS